MPDTEPWMTSYSVEKKVKDYGVSKMTFVHTKVAAVEFQLYEHEAEHLLTKLADALGVTLTWPVKPPVTKAPDIVDILGMDGRMISGSKADYLRRHPNNIVVFNANVCTDNGKIWFGDLDVTKDIEMLQEAADSLNCRLYILREHDARFANEEVPLLLRAVATFEPKNPGVIRFI